MSIVVDVLVELLELSCMLFDVDVFPESAVLTELSELSDVLIDVEVLVRVLVELSMLVLVAVALLLDPAVAPPSLT